MRKAAVFVLVLALLAAACGRSGRGDPEAELEEARRSFNDGYFLQSESHYEHYLQTNPQGKDRLEAWNRLVEIAVSVRGDLSKGLGLLEAMYLEFGRNPDMAWNLMYRTGELYDRQGRRLKALEAWEKCLDIPGVTKKQIAATRQRMAAAYRAQGNYDLAQSLYQECAEAGDTEEIRTGCLYELALTATFIKNNTLARSTLERIVKMPNAPQDTRDKAAFFLADLYEQDHRFAEAIALLEKIKPTYPNPLAVDMRISHLKKSK